MYILYDIHYACSCISINVDMHVLASKLGIPNPSQAHRNRIFPGIGLLVQRTVS